MPFVSTSRYRNGSSWAGAANALAKAFVGDPNEDAKIAKERIDASTEMAREKLIQEQTMSEQIRRTQMQAAAQASQAQASKNAAETEALGTKAKALQQMNKLSADLPNQYSDQATQGEMLRRGGSQMGPYVNDPNVQAQLRDKAFQNFGPLFTGQAMLAGIKPDDAKLPAAMLTVPTSEGQQQRDMLATGKSADQTVYSTPAGSRVSSMSGQEVVPLAPSFVGLENAQTNRNNAEAAKASRPGAGGKVPRAAPQDVSQMYGMLGKNLPGIKPADNGSFGTPFMQAIQGNPQIAEDLNNIAHHVYQTTGGDSYAVLGAMTNYMHGIKSRGKPVTDYSNLTPQPAGMFSDPVDYTPPSVDEILSKAGAGQQPAALSPAPAAGGNMGDLFTGGQAPAAPAAAPAGGNPAQLLQEANDAIAKGADPKAVKQRLQQMGIQQ